MNKPNYAVFILTHGRPDKVYTANTLKKSGYTGRVYYILDTDDDTIDQYRASFGAENIKVFDKQEILKTFDLMDNQTNFKCIVFARNACFGIAQELGLDYFIELDDDYTDFSYRFDQDYEYITNNPQIKSIDSIFESMITYLESAKLDTICLSQNGDFMGGKQSDMARSVKIKRKAMNSFILKTSNPITFMGRLNEDVNAYTSLGKVGKLLFTTSQISLKQHDTQATKGGMTETYQDEGRYVKSFYSVMLNPSSVKINIMGDAHKRIHHVIAWNHTVPKILEEKYKQPIYIS